MDSDVKRADHKDRLIIVGSGSLALHIYQIARLVGYEITVIDSHAETLTRDRFAEAQLLQGDVIELLRNCPIDANTSIVLVSHHHEWDEASLQAVIGSRARYIGVLGNKRKVTSYFSHLDGQGVPDELINKVYMPIGLDLGGQQAGEIALAVMAEIQAVKYGRPGGFLTVKHSAAGIAKQRESLFD
jgi:xanthine dehydrogenase accessory factor